MGTPSDSNNSNSEEAAEFVATVRGEHGAMKDWYNEHASAELKQKYGREYPALWKQVLNWNGWKESRKEYLKWEQLKEKKIRIETDIKTEEPVPAARKRKSRWGSASSNTSSTPTANDNNNKRASRWGNRGSMSQVNPSNNNNNNPVSRNSFLSGFIGGSSNLPPHKQQELQQLQTKLRNLNDRINSIERDAARVDALPKGHCDRSPSPPPVYGTDGKRKNTRAIRWRERFTAERQDAMERIAKLLQQGGAAAAAGAGAGLANSNNLAPHSLLSRKRTKKIRIPIDEHPNYNFIGLIIGPRGKTQKELELKTGCKIAIRGRGSVKEGARGRRDGKIMEGDNEPLHVVITGDDQRAVDAASDMVEQMLVVIDDEVNVHKQQQLRELALLNGTLKDEEFCTNCAQKGHRAFECPKRVNIRGGAGATNLVKCAICGDTSHPTRDCTRARAATGQGDNKEMDKDYINFMAELDGKPKGGGGGPPPSKSLPPPPPPPGGGGPPPPGQLLPPPPPQQHGPPPPQQQHFNQGQQSYYGQQQQQQQPPRQQHQQQQGYNNNHYEQQQQQYGQQQTQGWDPSSYYGYDGTGGAGGFNWWDQQ